MKNNWMQYLSPVLCAVMLIIILVQGNKLDEYRIQVNNQMESLKMSVGNDIEGIRYYIDNQLENTQKLVSSYELRPRGIDKDTHCLKAEVCVSLKEWYEDSEVELITTIGQNDVNAGMNSDGNGIFSGQILLPVEENNDVFLSVQISGGGLTRKEELGGWSDLSMLLPLQNGGGGWSGPVYRDGVMSSQFSITIRGFDDKLLTVQEEQDAPASVQNPEFHIYKNGELEQTINAVADSYAEGSNEINFSVSSPGSSEWSVECENGDVIDIHFVCRDEYGLGYDFFFQSWKAQSETTDNYGVGGITPEYSSSEALRLFW